MIDDETRGRTKGICLHFDGINQRLPFRLADYGDDGALTEDQICAVAESSGLDLDLARNLSVLLGYALDLDSQVNLVRVKPVKPGKHTRADDRNFKVSLVDVSIPEQKGSVNRWNNPQRLGSGGRLGACAPR